MEEVEERGRDGMWGLSFLLIEAQENEEEDKEEVKGVVTRSKAHCKNL